MADEGPESERDVEGFRRERNQRRRVYRRRNRRAAWLARIEELDPALHEELVELRGVSAQAFRKRLIQAAKEHGFYSPVDRWVSQDLPPLEVRRKEE